MYLLDTEALVELRKAQMRRGNKALRDWAAAVSIEDIYLSAITLQDLEIGARLHERDDPPRGKVMRDWLSRQVIPTFRDRILPIDAAVALRAGELYHQHKMDLTLAFVGATASLRGYTVVSRYTGSLKDSGVNVLSFWGT